MRPYNSGSCKDGRDKRHAQGAACCAPTCVRLSPLHPAHGEAFGQGEGAGGFGGVLGLGFISAGVVIFGFHIEEHELLGPTGPDADDVVLVEGGLQRRAGAFGLGIEAQELP